MIKTTATMLSAALVLGVATLPAAATNLDGPPPAYEGRATIWQGLYLGLSLGYGWGSSEHFYDRNNNHGTAQQSLTGGLGSVTMGYNYLISPSLLVGIEGDLGIMDLRADDKVIFDGHVWESQFGALWGTVRGRAGFLWNQRTLLYATAGLAFMQLDEVGYGDAAGQTAWNTDFRTGWVVGAGVEYALSSTMTAKLEYLHMDFGSYSGLSENREPYSFDNSVDLIRAGLSFKF